MYYGKGYFLNLPPHENVIEAVRYIIKKHPEIEVNVLSAVLLDSKYALAEKNAWLDKHLPEVDVRHRIFVPNGSDKKEWILEFNRDDVLLDDYTSNLLKWSPARGIKLLNSINHSKGTWQGDRVRFDKEPVQLANDIVSIVNMQEHIYDKSVKEAIVKVQSAAISNYEGYDVFAQYSRDSSINDKHLIFLGKRENYDNYGNYDNSDDSLVFISDNRKMFNFLRGSGWVVSQQEMLNNGSFTADDYAEFARLKETVLQQFVEANSIRFEIDMDKWEQGEESGVPFQYPNWERNKKERSNGMAEQDKIKVAIESTDDYADVNFHRDLTDVDIENEDGSYGRIVDQYRLVYIGENGFVQKLDERVFVSAEEARMAVQERDDLEFVSYDEMVNEAGNILQNNRIQEQIRKSKIICLDVETTGLSFENDEILQLSIIDGNGKVLFDDYIKPKEKEEWVDAEKIHGISKEMVQDKPTIDEHLPVLNQIMENADVIVGYNSNYFDLTFMKNAGINIPDNVEKFDVMREFAPIYGVWDSYHNDYKWQKLSVCADYYGYKGDGNFHDSLEDVRATLYCYFAMQEREKEKEQVVENNATISFYVAECMEFPSLGEYHEGLTLQEAFDIYDQIPSERMNAIKGIGFTLQDGSMYDGNFDLMHLNEVDEELINSIEHYHNSPLVQQAIKDCKAEVERRYGKEKPMSRMQEIIQTHDETFLYQLLGRMKSDCEYYLGYGNRNADNLWGKNEETHIADMKELYNSFSDDKKPEWLTMADIERFEKEITHSEDELQNKNDIIHENSENIHIDGHVGTWHVIGADTTVMGDINGKTVVGDYFLLEHDTYGDETAGLIVTKDGKVALENVYNGFDDLEEQIDSFMDTIEVLEDAGYEIVRITDSFECEVKDMNGNIRSFGNFEELVGTERSLVEDIYNRVIDAMEVAGYDLDILESTSKNPIYNYEGQSIPLRFESLKDNINWLDGVVFDDPEISNKVEAIMHPERMNKDEQEQEKVNPSEDLQYYKYFYSPDQAEEAKAFQEEKGWKRFWGSDNQGLNGDTIVVYRDIADLPTTLQDYARKQEHISLNAQADKIYREIITHVVDSAIYTMQSVRDMERAYAPVYDAVLSDAEAERMWEHERDRGHTWDIGENEIHYDRDAMFLKEYEGNKEILSAIQFGLEKGISEKDIREILDNVFEGDIYANPESAKELFEQAVDGVIERDISEYENYLKLYDIDLEQTPFDSSRGFDGYSLYMYKGELYLKESYLNGFSNISWVDAENRKLIHVTQDFEMGDKEIMEAIKTFGDNPNRENVIEVTDVHDKHLAELVSIVNEHGLDVLTEELNAREEQGIDDITINENFRGYTSDELREAKEFLENYEPPKNHYYEPEFDLDGTAEELFVQARNGYIESPEALAKVQEILMNPVERNYKDAFYVGILKEIAEDKGDEPYVFAQMKKDILDGVSPEEVTLRDGLTLEVMRENENVLVSLNENSEDRVAAGATAVMVEEFLDMDAKGFTELVNSVYAYNMIEEEREVEMERERITIDGQECYQIDSWENSGVTYILGQHIEDTEFFYARGVGEGKQYDFEFDYQPSREDIENHFDYRSSEIELNRYEEEFGADGRRAFPHLNDEPLEENSDSERKEIEQFLFESFKNGSITYELGGWERGLVNVYCKSDLFQNGTINFSTEESKFFYDMDVRGQEPAYAFISSELVEYALEGQLTFSALKYEKDLENVKTIDDLQKLKDTFFASQSIHRLSLDEIASLNDQMTKKEQEFATVRLAERIDSFMYDNDYYEYMDNLDASLGSPTEQLIGWISNKEEDKLEGVVKAIDTINEDYQEADEGIGNFAVEMREANDLIYSLEHLDEYYKYYGREIEENAKSPIREFHNDKGNVLEGERIPIEKSTMRGFADRSIVYYAVRDFEQENNLPENQRVIHNGSYEDKEFLYGGYDRYIGMSHRNDLSIQPYMERLQEMDARIEYSNHSLLPLVAEVYYAQQNKLSQKNIDFLLETAKDDRFPVDLIRNLRHGIEAGLSEKQLNVVVGESYYSQVNLLEFMADGGSIEDAMALKGGDVAEYYVIAPHLKDKTISREVAQSIVQTVKEMRSWNSDDYNSQREKNPNEVRPRFGMMDFDFFTEYLTQMAVEDNSITAEQIAVMGKAFLEQNETDNLRIFIENKGGFQNFHTHGEEGKEREKVMDKEEVKNVKEGVEQPEEKKDAKELLNERLQQGVKDILNSENFKKWLDTSSKMFLNNYSFNNALLVWAQAPEATHTMGYEQWKDYGRNVAEGAKGIKIFVPITAYEKKNGDLWRMIKSNLQSQIKNNPSLDQAVYRVGMSKLEVTMNQNGLYGLRIDGKEQGIRTEKEMQNLIKNNILGKVVMYFTVGTVFDVKDTVVPEHLWVKKGFTKDEMVKDENGKAIKNRRGEYKIVNTPERQAKFMPTLNMDVEQKDPVKMEILYDALKAVSERNGIHVYEKAREDDQTLKGGADGYFSRNFSAENPKGYIMMPTDLDPTRKVSVMLHEMSHSELHGNLENLAQKMGEDNIPRHMREIQAEAVAYVVGKNFGIETDMSSFQYLASYSKGFELQALSKSIEVIYNECRQLTNELKAELEVRGLNMDLSERNVSVMDKEAVESLSKSFATYIVEQDSRITDIEKELPDIVKQNSDKPQICDIIVQQSVNLERQKEDVEVIRTAITELESADTLEKQKEQINVIESAKERIENYKGDFDSLSVQFQKLAQERQGLKDLFVADPIATIESMKKDYPKLEQLTGAQMQYLAKSEYVSRELAPLLRNEPEKFVDKAVDRATQIDKVASKNGMFVEVNFCEQWTDKPIVNGGAIMHPKVADTIIKQGEAQIRGLKAQAENVGEYFPYNKCSLMVYQAEKGEIKKTFQTRVDIGDGEQASLTDHLKQVSTKDFVESFEKATREKGAKEKILFNETHDVQVQKEKGEKPLCDRAMNHEEWNKEIGTEKEKDGNTRQNQQVQARSGKSKEVKEK